MSEKERVIQLLDDVPAYKMGYILAYVQGLTADEDADDAFCEQLLQNYLKDDSPDKHESISLEEFAAQEGIAL